MAIQNQQTRISPRGYAAIGSVSYHPFSTHIAAASISGLVSLSSGMYVASGSVCYAPKTIHIYSLAGYVSVSDIFVVQPPVARVYVAPTVLCCFSSEPSVPGDDTVHIGFGQRIDFTAIPRYGFDPLSVQFINKCNGTIREFYWTFGDQRRSFHSDPSHVYARGVYDVTLRVRIANRTFTLKKRRYIIALPKESSVSRTNRCIRQAILPEQGIGFYEMPVAAMAMPEAGVGAITVYDTNNQIRGLVLDSKTGRWYDVTTRDGPAGTGLVKVWTGINSAEFDRTIKFKEDRGTDEKDFQRLIESHLFLRPTSELNRNVSGYDANGYPDGMEIDLAFFNNGEPTTPSASIVDVPLNGDIKTDKKVEGNRVQMQVTINRGAHIILNRLNIYDSSRRAAAPDKRVMSEMDFQGSLAEAVFWASYFNDSLINRITGTAITLVGTTAVEGPENTGDLTATEFTAPITPGSVNIASGSVLLWIKGTAALTIAGTAIALTDLGTANGFTLKYADGITKNGNVVLTPTGTAAFADCRVFASALATAAKSYYLTDVQDNAGGIVLP